MHGETVKSTYDLKCTILKVELMVCLIQDPLNTYVHVQWRRGKHTVTQNDDTIPILSVQYTR